MRLPLLIQLTLLAAGLGSAARTSASPSTLAFPEPPSTAAAPVDVWLVPVGAISPELVASLTRHLTLDLGLTVAPAPALAEDPQMLGASGQLLASQVRLILAPRLAALDHRSPKVTCLLLVAKDLNNVTGTAAFTFVSHLSHRESIVSLARLDETFYDRPAQPDLLEARAFKMVKRAIGIQYYGYPFSTNHDSVLFSPVASVAQLDAIGTDFQPAQGSLVQEGLESKIYTAGGIDRTPRVIEQARPVYPVVLRITGDEGFAVVDFVVAATGQPVSVHAVAFTNRLFAESAEAAVSQWRFSPGLKNGQAVAAHMMVPVAYNLSPDAVDPTVANIASETARLLSELEREWGNRLAAAKAFPANRQKMARARAKIGLVVDPDGRLAWSLVTPPDDPKVVASLDETLDATLEHYDVDADMAALVLKSNGLEVELQPLSDPLP